LFGDIGGVKTKLELSNKQEIGIREKLAWEKELLGLYISGHPLNEYKEKIEKFGTLIKKIKEEGKVGSMVTVACILDDVRVIMTKKNDRMAFIKVSDFTGSIEAVVFSKTFEANKEILINDNIIAMQGRITERNGEKSIAIENLKKI
jgi:DNA polymerase-3 subunit alpha